jgi:pseudaminic acid biosynthesis-associated methylase
MSQYKTEQEAFWAGDFGVEYISRNSGSELLASNLAFFSKALSKVRGLGNCIEFGANIGINLSALRFLYPKQDQYAIEINPEAATELGKIMPSSNIFQTSILDFYSDHAWDLVLIKGVLIHINPDFLPQVYDALYRATNRYLLVCEYYNPSPVAINYRGHANKLFKRDFCGEILDLYSNLRLIDYGFVYHRDPFPQDDMNWFLMEKRP